MAWYQVPLSHSFSKPRCRYPTWMSRSTMFSPSSSMRNLTVPCVAGCEGPMLSSWCSTWRSFSKSSASGGSGSPTSGSRVAIALIPRPHQRLPLLLGIVLAQRMAVELLVQKYPAQVGVPPEADPVEVPHLALHPVRRGPEGAQARDLGGVLGHARPGPDPRLPLHRVQLADHLESRLLAQVVDRGQVGEQLEREARLVAQQAHDPEQAAACAPRGGIAEVCVARLLRAGEELQ